MNLDSYYCRLCIVKIEDNLFSDITELDNGIYTKIQMHLNLDIKKNDVSSSTVCTTCIEKVNSFHEYYQQVQDNQVKFCCLLNLTANDADKEISFGTFETVTLETDSKDLELHVDTILENPIRRSIRKKFNPGQNVSETEVGLESKINIIDNLEIHKNEFNKKRDKRELSNISKETENDLSKNTKCKRLKKTSKEIISENVILNELSDGFIAKTKDQCLNNLNKLGEIATKKSEQNVIASDLDKESNDDDDKNMQENSNVEPFPKVVFKDGKFQMGRRELKQQMERFFLLTCNLCPSEATAIDNSTCVSKFPTINSLFSHYEDIHGVKGYVSCCGKKIFRKNMPHHFAYHVNPEEFTCKLCNFKATRQYSLKLHVERVHDSNRKKFNCQLCDKNYTTTASLEQHQLEKHPSDNEEKNKSKCQECDKLFSSDLRLKKHMKNVHADKIHICDICGMKFRLKGNLKYHQLTHSTVKNFQCEICGKWFINQNMIRRHLKRAHPSNDELKCDQCDYTTLKIENLKNHLRIKHSDEKPYSCIYCDRKFKTSTNQKEHLAQHTGIKIQCEFCSKEFLTKSYYYAHRKKAHYQELMASNANLKTHHSTHENPDNIKCDVCGSWSRNKFLAKLHFLRHHAPKEILKCDQCDYTSTAKRNLKKHQKMKHSQLRPFLCPYCNHSTKTQTNLNDHLSQHTGIRTQCTYCPKQFLSKSNYYAHRRKWHTEEIQKENQEKELKMLER